MLYNDFAKTKEYLKAQLPEYLRNKGININAPFRCLNPDHQDIHPSMSYNPKNHTVHCFSCNATYDIFEIIGLDFGLTEFKDQFTKACELFLSTGDNDFIEANDDFSGQEQPNDFRLQDNNEEDDDNDNVEPFNFSSGKTPGPVSFGLADSDFRSESSKANNIPFNNFSIRQREEDDPLFHKFDPLSDDAQDFNNSRRSSFHPTQGAVFGVKNNFNDIGTGNKNSFGQNDSHFSDFRTEIRHNYSEYLKQCASQRLQTDYFRLRGISETVAEKFRLGFDNDFAAGIDPRTGDKIIWQAVIIPYSETAYMARNTDPRSKDRIRKQGSAGIFNQNALDKPGIIFITEGEFDALSIETLGYSAVSLGGVSNIRKLLDYIQEHPVYERMFYITLDDDKAGAEAAAALAQGLEYMHVPFKRINLAFPYKDPNEALCKDRETLLTRLNNLERMLSFSLQTVPLQPKTYAPILSAVALYSLQLSPCLYSLSGRSAILKRLVAEIISAKVQTDMRIIYVGTKEQWNMVCSLLKRREHYDDGAIFAPWNRAKLLEIQNTDDLPQAIEEAVSALYLQGEKNFCPIIDLTGLTSSELRNCLMKLSSLSAALKTPFISLCNENETITAEAYALQNIEVSMNDKNDLSFFTYDLLGRDQKFSIY